MSREKFLRDDQEIGDPEKMMIFKGQAREPLRIHFG
jgi:hypothetical protein